MIAEDMIKKLKRLKPDEQVLISNEMGSPAYDYEGQRFAASFSLRKRTITIIREVGPIDDQY